MSLIRKIKMRCVSSTISLGQSFGIDIQKFPTLVSEIKRSRSIRDSMGRLSASQELVRKYPDHPKAHFELAQCLHLVSDPHEFEQFDRYGEVRKEWLQKTGLDAMEVEFIAPAWL